MTMEEWGLYSLKKLGWNAEAAQEKTAGQLRGQDSQPGQFSPEVPRRCKGAVARPRTETGSASSLPSSEHDFCAKWLA